VTRGFPKHIWSSAHRGQGQQRGTPPAINIRFSPPITQDVGFLAYLREWGKAFQKERPQGSLFLRACRMGVGREPYGLCLAKGSPESGLSSMSRESLFLVR
jgi:hypothetical protein